MERQLDARAAALLEAAVESKGIEVVLEPQTARDRRRGQRRARRAEGRPHLPGRPRRDGRRHPARRRRWRASGGLAGEPRHRGRRRLADATARLHAIGECAEHRGTCYGLVEPAYEQASVLAAPSGGRPARYAGSRAGDQPQGLRRARVLRRRLRAARAPRRSSSTTTAHGRYRKLVMRDGRLAGAVLFGDTADALWYRDLIRSGDTSVAAIRAAARLRPGAHAEAACMSAQDFTDDQKRYLEGFVSGVQARRAAQGSKPLRRRRRRRPQPAGPDADIWRPWRASRRPARSCRPRRRPSATSIPSMPMRA